MRNRMEREVLTPAAGHDVIEGLFPTFNGYESKFTAHLTDEERTELGRLLRIVTATADGTHLTGDA